MREAERSGRRRRRGETVWHRATNRSPVSTVCRLCKMNGRIMCVTRWQKPISHRDSSELGPVASQNSKMLLGRARQLVGVWARERAEETGAIFVRQLQPARRVARGPPSWQLIRRFYCNWRQSSAWNCAVNRGEQHLMMNERTRPSQPDNTHSQPTAAVFLSSTP